MPFRVHLQQHGHLDRSYHRMPCPKPEPQLLSKQHLVHLVQSELPSLMGNARQKLSGNNILPCILED